MPKRLSIDISAEHTDDTRQELGPITSLFINHIDYIVESIQREFVIENGNKTCFDHLEKWVSLLTEEIDLNFDVNYIYLTKNELFKVKISEYTPKPILALLKYLIINRCMNQNITHSFYIIHFKGLKHAEVFDTCTLELHIALFKSLTRFFPVDCIKRVLLKQHTDLRSAICKPVDGDKSNKKVSIQTTSKHRIEKILLSL